MPYVTEQLKFNLDSANAEISNKAATRQPSPMLFNGIENRHDYNNTMERAMLLAKRDIRLGNFPKDDDLDHIPVKEDKVNQYSNVTKPRNAMVHSSFSPGRTLLSQRSDRKPYESRKAAFKPNECKFLKVNISSAESNPPPPNKSMRSISMMIDNLEHAYTDLGRPTSRQGFPDPIVEVRLQRRVEEQRRHLSRLLYNTKRHVSQIVDQLKRTAVIHRAIVLTESNVFSHMNSAYRSLMSALNSFIRVSRTLHSTYMTDLVTKVRGDLKLLIQEFRVICELLNIQILSSMSPPHSPVQVAPTNSMVAPVSKLHLTPKVSQVTGAPLSPDRNESLKAAIKSLLVNNMSKIDISARELSSPPPTTQKKNLVINKKAPSKRPSTSKVIKPKSTGNVSRYNTNYKRAMSAGVKRGKRPLGKTNNVSTRPTSAPNQSKLEPLEIRGKVTPLITERELARQAWIDELGKGERPTSTDLTQSLEDVSPDEKDLHEMEEIKPKTIAIPHAESGFKSKELSTTMTHILDELEEIEKEDEDIRSRWLHIQYSNPMNINKDSSPIFLPSADLVSTYISPAVESSCSKTGEASLQISKHKIRQIESYKEAMLQYLRLTKHFKTRGFDPWATINGIVDNIVSDLVEDVCHEIINSCDGIADNIYLSEFLPA